MAAENLWYTYIHTYIHAGYDLDWWKKIVFLFVKLNEVWILNGGFLTAP